MKPIPTTFQGGPLHGATATLKHWLESVQIGASSNCDLGKPSPNCKLVFGIYVREPQEDGTQVMRWKRTTEEMA